MNNTFSLEQVSRTWNLDTNIILRQRKWELMARFMEIKSINQKLKQKEIAKQFDYSCSTLQRFRHDRKMHSPYKPKKPEKPSNNDLESLKWPQKDLWLIQLNLIRKVI